MIAHGLGTAVRQAGAAVVILATMAVSAPATAQDFFGLFRLFAPPVYQQPQYQPNLERRIIRRRPKAARVEAPVAITPKAPGEAIDPLPELLRDRTLRRGDVVMFPDGPRVFIGEPGASHALTDFVPVSRAGRVVSASTRKLLASLRPDRSLTWTTETSDRLANTPRVHTTGTVSRRRH